LWQSANARPQGGETVDGGWGAFDDLAKPAGEDTYGPVQKWSAARRISNVNENENENEKTLLSPSAAPLLGSVTIAELISAYEIAVQGLEEGDFGAAQINWLDALFAVFNFEPATEADADTLVEFIVDNPEAFSAWLLVERRCRLS
jgi:hypothetical protein